MFRRRRARAGHVRLGVYVDTVYRTDQDDPNRVFTNSEAIPFMHFVCEVASQLGTLVLFGRRGSDDERTRYALPGPALLVELPHYPNLADAPRVARAAGGTLRSMWRGVANVDALLVFGPHPFGLALILFGLIRRRTVVIGVRQDTMPYYRARLRSPRMAPALVLIWAINHSYRLLARRLPTIVAGGHVEQQYGGPRPGLEALRISLVRAKDVADHPTAFPECGRVEILTVGRVDPEKNPMLLVEAMRELQRRQPGRFHLRWLGEGRLDEQVRDQLREHNLEDCVTMMGFVAFGPGLLDLYRRAAMFVHVATTEAFGQVLTEAMASGTPIVATDVGGVHWALDEGRTGLLVPPSNRDALVAAIERMASEPDTRLRYATRGLEFARLHPLEAEAERVARLFRPADYR